MPIKVRHNALLSSRQHSHGKTKVLSSSHSTGLTMLDVISLYMLIESLLEPHTTT